MSRRRTRDLDQLDDITLMQRVAEGRDMAALGALQARHWGLVRRIALRMVRDPWAADEVAQDVFLDLWRHPLRFDPTRGRFLPWLQLVARYQAINRWRRDHGPVARRTFLLAEFVDGPSAGLDELAPPGPGADQAALNSVIAASVRAALEHLPAVQKEAVVLTYLVGYSMPEVAQLLGVPLSTVKTRVRDARKRLRRSLHRLSRDTGGSW